MNSKIHLFNKILLTISMICLICYDVFGGLWLKGFTSFWFVLIGLLNLFHAIHHKCTNKKYVVLMTLGLICGMLADVLLGIVFSIGILVFALGHIFYLFAFYTLDKFKLSHLLIIVPISIASIYIITGTPFIQINDPTLKILLVGYAIIISCMLSKAITNFKSKRSFTTRLVLIASVLFFFSDFILAIDMFGESSRLTWILCSYSYWPAQNLLAYSLYHFVNENKDV